MMIGNRPPSSAGVLLLIAAVNSDIHTTRDDDGNNNIQQSLRKQLLLPNYKTICTTIGHLTYYPRPNQNTHMMVYNYWQQMIWKNPS
jgi:hypothetical protein